MISIIIKVMPALRFGSEEIKIMCGILSVLDRQMKLLGVTYHN
jgi:hypothetical protein